MMAREPLCKPIMAKLVTDLPEPDSPTMPSVFPFSMENETPFTALTSPSSVGNWTVKSFTLKMLMKCAPLDPVLNKECRPRYLKR